MKVDGVAVVRPGARGRGRSSWRPAPSPCRGSSCWPGAATTLDVTVECRPAPTSARWPATSAPPSASAGTSRRCGAPGSARSGSTSPARWSSWPRTLRRCVPLDDAVAAAFPRRELDRRGGGRAVVRQASSRRPAPPGTVGAFAPGRPVHRPASRTATASRGRRRLRARRLLSLGRALAGWGRAALARGRERAVRLGAVRGDDRRVRRRPPRPPADHRPGRGRARDARGAARGAHLRPAPERGRAARQPPADAHQPALQGRAARGARRRRRCACCRSRWSSAG